MPRVAPRSEDTVTGGYWVLPREASSAREARAAIESLLVNLDTAADDVEAAVQVVSELVSNVVRHAHSADVIEIALDADDGVIRLEVVDNDPRPPLGPVGRDGAGSSEEGGRGLFLVEMLASEWGWDPIRGNGKRVWCTFHPNPVSP
jgi:anti-sigma regulatory factor (Ser/Thr protein kinase)